jgi:hypothetical protein
MTTYGGMGAETIVMLELARRASGDTTGGSITTNRIGLLCNTIDVSTNKQSIPFPVPFSGLAAGESKTIALDFGTAQKTLSITGILMPQQIVKQKGTGESITIDLTAHEVAQLLHSYVDSSFLHEDQNLSKLIVLIPSKANTDFEARSGTTGKSDSELPLIPFTWANRDYDVPKYSFGNTPFPDVFASTTDEIEGITGFIDTFTTNLVGTDYPSIPFNLTFTHASTGVSDFINRVT